MSGSIASTSTSSKPKYKATPLAALGSIGGGRRVGGTSAGTSSTKKKVVSISVKTPSPPAGNKDNKIVGAPRVNPDLDFFSKPPTL